MEDVKSTTIVPIAIYCFILAVFFLSLGLNTIFSNTDINFVYWIGTGTAAILAIGLIYIGIGFLNLKILAWKVLFFCLAIGVSTTTSLILAYYIMLGIGIDSIAVYFHLNQITPVLWYSLLAVFLSAIIVLYYLTHKDVVSAFGGIGDLISPV